MYQVSLCSLHLFMFLPKGILFNFFWFQKQQPVETHLIMETVPPEGVERT